MSISAGPLFKFNPSVSFIVNFDPLLFKSSSSPEKEARKKIDIVWEKLSEGGSVLMPIDKYPFSERYGWLKDKYGLSWQIVPVAMDQMISDQDPKRAERVAKSFLQMKKFNLAELERAYNGV